MYCHITNNVLVDQRSNLEILQFMLQFHEVSRIIDPEIVWSISHVALFDKQYDIVYLVFQFDCSITKPVFSPSISVLGFW